MENRGLLSFVLAVGVVLGTTGGFLLTRVGAPAQGAEPATPAVETPEPVNQPVTAPEDTVATAAPVPPVVTRPAAIERRQAPTRTTGPAKRTGSVSACVTGYGCRRRCAMCSRSSPTTSVCPCREAAT